MSRADCRGRLVDASKKLMTDWRHVKELWRDKQCHQFEKTTIDVLRAEIQATLQAIEQVNNTLNRVHHDCSEKEDLGI
jgi:hypothetical protein